MRILFGFISAPSVLDALPDISGQWFPIAANMALVAAVRFPLLADQILAVAVSATVFFELVGPVLTRMALAKVAESEKQ
jgi:hypothetical protein